MEGIALSAHSTLQQTKVVGFHSFEIQRAYPYNYKFFLPIFQLFIEYIDKLGSKYTKNIQKMLYKWVRFVYICNSYV